MIWLLIQLIYIEFSTKKRLTANVQVSWKLPEISGEKYCYPEDDIFSAPGDILSLLYLGDRGPPGCRLFFLPSRKAKF